MKERTIRLIAGLTLILIAQSLPSAQAKPKAPNPVSVSYSILHAIPAGYGADIVDVYVNGTLAIDNATPGAFKALAATRGNISVAIYANGVVPSATATALLTAGPIYISNGMNPTFVAHLSNLEKPLLSIYRNMTSAAGSKRSWLTVRHIAAAPEVGMKLNGYPFFMPIESGAERKRSLNYATYTVTAFAADSPTVTIGSSTLELKPGANVILYLWGARAKGNLSFFKQEIPTR